MTTQAWESGADFPPMPQEFRDELLQHRRGLLLLGDMSWRHAPRTKVEDHQPKGHEGFDRAEQRNLLIDLDAIFYKSGTHLMRFIRTRLLETSIRLDEMQLECARTNAMPAQQMIETLRQDIADDAKDLLWARSCAELGKPPVAVQSTVLDKSDPSIPSVIFLACITENACDACSQLTRLPDLLYKRAQEIVDLIERDLEITLGEGDYSPRFS